jgi:putative endonuclease
MQFFAYILRSSKTGHLYKGHTENISLRLTQHNSGKTKSTKNGAPWTLVYFEVYNTRNEAIEREKYFKSGSGRRFLKELDLSHQLEVPSII